MEEQVFNIDDTGLFYKDIDEWIHTMQMVLWLMKTLWTEAPESLTLYFPQSVFANLVFLETL